MAPSKTRMAIFLHLLVIFAGGALAAIPTEPFHLIGVLLFCIGIAPLVVHQVMAWWERG